MKCIACNTSNHHDSDNLDDFMEHLSTRNLSNLSHMLKRLQTAGAITSLRCLTLQDGHRLQELQKSFPAACAHDDLVDLYEASILFLHLHDYVRRPSLATHLQPKLINDPVHGNVQLHPIAVRIVDTPQFQRLRHIKQVACLNRVFPGGDHTRFEHSIGTYHLAGKLINLLKEKQPELHISPLDALCVQLAGLCHDLGHGPFSHLFDAKFIPAVARQSSGNLRIRLESWRHEDTSIRMFDHLIKDNGLMVELTQWGFSERDITFIKEMIHGPLDQNTSSGWPYMGRSIEKAFLYEVVSNKRNGLDVDRWDYIARDCLHLGIKASFDHNRLMLMIRVINVDGEPQLCVKKNETGTLYDLFATRYDLHRKAYQHRVNITIELMLTEALRLADPYLFFTGTNGKSVHLSGCIDDMVAFTKLTDHLYTHILWSETQELRPARELLQRIEKRKLWVCLGEMRPPAGSQLIAEDIVEGICKVAQEHNSETPHASDSCQHSISMEDICAAVVTMDYGMGEDNPVKHMRFYTKKEPHSAVPYDHEEFSHVLPTHFRNRKALVFCTRECATAIRVASEAFTKWCGINKFSIP